MAKKYAMLVKVDGTNNNNKFYEITWNDDDTVTTRWGRTGDAGTVEHKGVGEAAFNKVYKAKTGASKGYKEVDVMTNTGSIPSSTIANTSVSLAEVAKRDIANNNPVMGALLDKLAKINKYQLLHATGDQIDIVNGVVQTALGPVSLDAVTKARTELLSLNNFIKINDTGSQFGEHLNQYLTYIPQKVPRKRGWDQVFFTEHSSFQKQNDLLDQIETSIKLKLAEPVSTDVKDEVKQQRVFGYSLELLEDAKEFDRINTFYMSNVNKIHSCSHLKLKHVYKAYNKSALELYKEKLQTIGNEKELWHGSRAHNALSILKAGLQLSKPSTVANGSMFGDNSIYLSDQSSKSLNYSFGYWGGNSYDNNCFMFLTLAALGRQYIPTRPENGNKPGYDSCYAIGGKSGVMNNEMIVYNKDQVYINYLCEFDA